MKLHTCIPGQCDLRYASMAVCMAVGFHDPLGRGSEKLHVCFYLRYTRVRGIDIKIRVQYTGNMRVLSDETSEGYSTTEGKSGKRTELGADGETEESGTLGHQVCIMHATPDSRLNSSRPSVGRSGGRLGSMTDPLHPKKRRRSVRPTRSEGRTLLLNTLPSYV